jgi:hypothetical protein
MFLIPSLPNLYFFFFLNYFYLLCIYILISILTIFYFIFLINSLCSSHTKLALIPSSFCCKLMNNEGYSKGWILDGPSFSCFIFTFFQPLQLWQI